MSRPIYYKYNKARSSWDAYGANNKRLADERYEDGEIAGLKPVKGRSKPSHDHQFAMIELAFDNLPEVYTGRWKDPKKLRKWALIQAGYHKTNTIPFETATDAEMFMLWARSRDDEVEMQRIGTVVLIKTAESQSRQEMGATEFQECKDRVLAICSALIGVDVTTLKKEGGDEAGETGVFEEDETGSVHAG